LETIPPTGKAAAVPEKPRVIIVGAGFAGLAAARSLARSQADVLILDRNNYHTFFPLLYQVAAAELEPEDIIYPVRNTLRGKKNVRLLLDQVNEVDIEKKIVKTPEHSYSYDYLILAPGSKPHFFGVEGAAEYSYLLKSIEDAIATRNHILTRFELALHEPDAEKRKQMLTFAIIGGGPTGVEYSGALAELFKGPLSKDYAELDFGEVRLLLLEASGRLLAGLPEKLQDYALKRLIKMGVEVRLGTPVTRITAESIELKDGTVIRLETAIWTAGVQGSPPSQAGSLTILKNGQVKVLPTLQVEGHPESFITGDLAFVEREGKPLPMVASLAVQEGEMAARNIRRQMKGQDTLPFHYQDLGTLAVIGRNAAAVNLLGWNFTGFFAWLFWLGLHIYRLIGFRNRLIVLVNWAWDYLFFERGVRLIVPLPEEGDKPKPAI